MTTREELMAEMSESSDEDLNLPPLISRECRAALHANAMRSLMAQPPHLQLYSQTGVRCVLRALEGIALLTGIALFAIMWLDPRHTHGCE